jgi:hypothetical protein
MSLADDPPSVDAQMMSPPSSFAVNNISTTNSSSTTVVSTCIGVSTASLLSASVAPVASTVDLSSAFMMDESLMTEEDKLGDTMFDLGDIGNLGGGMDDMTNF